MSAVGNDIIVKIISSNQITFNIDNITIDDNTNTDTWSFQQIRILAAQKEVGGRCTYSGNE